MPPHLGGVGRENPEVGLIVSVFGEKRNKRYIIRRYERENND